MDHQAFAQLLGNYGEFVGAIAVVVTLFYLARQIHTSNRLSRAEAWRAPTNNLNSINSAFSTDPIFRKALQLALFENADPEELNQDERMILSMYLISLTNIYEQIYREIREGILDEKAIEDFAVQGMFEMNFYKTNWPVYRQNLGPSFADYFEIRFKLLENASN